MHPKVACRRRDMFKEEGKKTKKKNRLKSSQEGTETIIKGWTNTHTQKKRLTKRAFSEQFPWLFYHNGVLFKLPFSRHEAQPPHTNQNPTTSGARTRNATTNSHIKKKKKKKSSQINRMQNALHAETMTIVCNMNCDSQELFQHMSSVGFYT